MMKKLFLFMLTMVGMVALVACNNTEPEADYPEVSIDTTTPDVDSTDIYEDNEDYPQEIDANDNAANFEVLYAMTSQLLYEAENINVEDVDAFTATLQNAIAITSAVVEDESLTQFTRDLASVVYELAVNHMSMADDFTIELLPVIQPIIWDNFYGLHIQFVAQLEN